MAGEFCVGLARGHRQDPEADELGQREAERLQLGGDARLQHRDHAIHQISEWLLLQGGAFVGVHIKHIDTYQPG
ncbi:hypothetical protein ATO49_11450 [Mycolicibacterium fortuitum subsp. fortuitum DSM 46621 = ATCC 6841 = JCM 6387]|nr:hypothetical protein ATO49_11450 [Mycolicibacterium fortuitum subsp. fortuitum DSM 46621 = ATCC 6841 = JCM 6387]